MRARGVGFPKVLRRSPLTLFSGERYRRSKSSGGMEILPAVRMRSSSLGWTCTPLVPSVKKFVRSGW